MMTGNSERSSTDASIVRDDRRAGRGQRFVLPVCAGGKRVKTVDLRACPEPLGAS